MEPLEVEVTANGDLSVSIWLAKEGEPVQELRMGSDQAKRLASLLNQAVWSISSEPYPRTMERELERTAEVREVEQVNQVPVGDNKQAPIDAL
jgi:hypothetical protein